MKMPIVIKTYRKDLEWLYWCLRSLDKFAVGFGPVHIIGETDADELAAIKDTYERARIDSLFAGIPARLVYHVHSSPPGAGLIASGYIRQQYCKMLADTMLKGAFDRHLQLDSDCFLTRRVTPEEWGDPPYWLRTPWEALHGHAEACARKPELERILGFSVPYEYMRRHPFVLRHDGLRALRAHLTTRYGIPLAELMAGEPGWSEYNLYGAFCAHILPDLHRWVSTHPPEGVPMDAPPSCVQQAWSYAAHEGRGIPADVLDGYKRLLESAQQPYESPAVLESRDATPADLEKLR